jgi:hypothetical protein
LTLLRIGGSRGWSGTTTPCGAARNWTSSGDAAVITTPGSSGESLLVPVSGRMASAVTDAAVVVDAQPPPLTANIVSTKHLFVIVWLATQTVRQT